MKGNVEFGLKMAGVDKNKRDTMMQQYLKMVNLEPYAEWFISQLSTGMKQRVAIARALVMDPAILIMDEPFAALDYVTKRELMKYLSEIWIKTNKMVIFVTHDLMEATILGTHVVKFSKRPGAILLDFSNDISHPRDPDDIDVMRTVKQFK